MRRRQLLHSVGMQREGAAGAKVDPARRCRGSSGEVVGTSAAEGDRCTGSDPTSGAVGELFPGGRRGCHPFLGQGRRRTGQVGDRGTAGGVLSSAAREGELPWGLWKEGMDEKKIKLSSWYLANFGTLIMIWVIATHLTEEYNERF